MNKVQDKARPAAADGRRAVACLALTSAALMGLGAAASGQGVLTVSVDYKGPPTVSTGTNPQEITGADLLVAPLGGPAIGPLPPPQIAFDGTEMDVAGASACVGQPHGTPCAELDALSGGMDGIFEPVGPPVAGKLIFTVDEWAQGQPGVPMPPNVESESPTGDSSADIWIDLGLMPGPVPPTVPPVGHTGLVDGDGLPGPSGRAYPGLGLIEGNVPIPGAINPGDNIDAIDFGTLDPPVAGSSFAFPAGGYYYSVDSAILDPDEGIPNSGTSLQQGVSGADILVRFPGAPAVVYATAADLGLSADFDDVDALILRENGLPGFQVSTAPYDWLSPSAPSDMLLFSVRKGSDIIGQLDDIFGVPIEPGDLLVPPDGRGTTPGIFISAESLGLRTLRGGSGQSDDLNGADKLGSGETFLDCNSNGVDDSVDVATGYSSDVNMDGVPDECQAITSQFCFCLSGPCSNSDSTAGCQNSTGSGALLAASGTTSITNDDLVFSCTNAIANEFGIFFMGGASTNIPFYDGHLCVANGTPGIYRFLPPVNSGPSATYTLGPGLAALTCSLFPAQPGCFASGQTWYIQVWYRDNSGPCGSGANFSNGMDFTLTP